MDGRSKKNVSANETWKSFVMQWYNKQVHKPENFETFDNNIYHIPLRYTVSLCNAIYVIYFHLAQCFKFDCF